MRRHRGPQTMVRRQTWLLSWENYRYSIISSYYVESIETEKDALLTGAIGGQTTAHTNIV